MFARKKCSFNVLLRKQLFVVYLTVRSSRPEVFCKKVVLRNFAKFKGKHLCQSLFFNKRDLRPEACNFIVKETWHRSSCEVGEISKNTFFTEHLRATAYQGVRNVSFSKNFVYVLNG